MKTQVFQIHSNLVQLTFASVPFIWTQFWLILARWKIHEYHGIFNFPKLSIRSIFGKSREKSWKKLWNIFFRFYRIFFRINILSGQVMFYENWFVLPEFSTIIDLLCITKVSHFGFRIAPNSRSSVNFFLRSDCRSTFKRCIITIKSRNSRMSKILMDSNGSNSHFWRRFMACFSLFRQIETWDSSQLRLDCGWRH